MQVGTGDGVAWDPKGGATVDLYRLAPGELVLQREWDPEVDVSEAPAAAEVIGQLTVVTGGLVVLWSPFGWQDLTHPPPPDEQVVLSTGGMAGIGMQVQVPLGPYTCAVVYADDAYRCWISRHP